MGDDTLLIRKAFLVDALVDGPFSGTPVSVIFLEKPMERFKMASLAFELGASETVYALSSEEAYLLCFFSSQTEIKLGVNASLSAAHLIYELGLQPPGQPVRFLTQAGQISARLSLPDTVSLDLATMPVAKLSQDRVDRLAPCLSLDPSQVEWAAMTELNEAILAVSDHSVLKRIEPDRQAILDSGLSCLAATCPSRPGDCDYYLRAFLPRAGLLEDPASGGLHRSLAPQWGRLMGKKSMAARQLSRRGGLSYLELRETGGLTLSARAATVLRSDVVTESLVKPLMA
jgi:PhzF family phenazine biosynthesis protein